MKFEIQIFKDENSFWLEDYSLFISLKYYFKGHEWSKWDEDILFYNGPWSLEEVRSEITCLNTMLQLLVSVGCVEYWPGWGMKYSAAAETRKAIITNVERLYTYYKETYQEGEGDD